MNKFAIKFSTVPLLMMVSACQMNKQEPAPVVGYDTPGPAMPRTTPLLKYPDYIIVGSGDSLSTITRKYHISTGQIIRLNNLKPPYNLMIDQKLWLKRKVVAVKKTNDQTAYNYVPTVKSGSVKPSTVVAPLLKRKPFDNTPINLMSPSIKTTVKNTESNLKPVDLELARHNLKLNKEAGLTPLPPLIVAQSSNDLPVKNTAIVNETFDTIPATEKKLQSDPATQTKFAWPIKGKIVTKFGAMDTGFQNDGINIEAQEGDPIRASDSGIVAYVGNELQGFGNLVMIKHPSGWMSAYAHCSEFLVKRGDKVNQGDKIARVGHTGNVRTPQLHFELRKKTKAVDPLTYLE